MKKQLLLLTILIVTALSSSAQKKSTTPKPTKKPITATTTTKALEVKEVADIPFVILNLAPSNPVSQEVIAKVKSQGINLSGNDFKIPRSTERGFMYDSFLLYKENLDAYLINLKGDIEKIPTGSRLITVTKNNYRVLADACKYENDWTKCRNIRIIDSNGKTISPDFSQYYYGQMESFYNSEDHTYIIVSASLDSQNIITEEGKTLFPKDVSKLSFILPGYIYYEEGGKRKLMELNTKKITDLSGYSRVTGLRVNSYLVGELNGKNVLINPVNNKVLFETDKLIGEVHGLDDSTPKNYFALGGFQDVTLVGINGKKILEDQYKRVYFQNDGITFFVENKQGKENFYNLAKKAFVYKDFYTQLKSEGELTLVKYQQYYEVYNNMGNSNTSNDGYLMYDESKKVTDVQICNNLLSITKKIDENNTLYDVYSALTHTFLYENVKSFGRIRNADYYYIVNKTGEDNKRTIINGKGAILVDEIIVPDYIQYNNSKGYFEFTKKFNGKPTECYDKKGVKIECTK
ncbi:hypothetical protein [Flavobacterium chungbukense]|uniref:WG repeat protein n=1 Tax=Flavobacterium chungbukense TaxID=877464 RepID=A0ABP7XMI8_9FLAO|nr:hypothetical protein [Flavobacterium chungbukense]MCC4920655.1 hypothetical protein [Flavobacterium chungbukense]